MLKGIPAALEQAADDPRVKVVRLGGAGRGFSSGAGISEDDQVKPGASGTPADVLDAANGVVRSIVNLPQPVVAVVQGPAAGVGASLALACDVVLASEKRIFHAGVHQIGLMPDGGASALIAASVGRTAPCGWRCFRADPGAEAYEWGLVTAVYPADQLDAEVDKVVGPVASGPVAACARPSTRSMPRRLLRWRRRWSVRTGPVGAAGIQRLPRGRAPFSSGGRRISPTTKSGGYA